jgi:hypothetical protein
MRFFKVCMVNDPEMAEQWAMTLPVGQDRNASLNVIYSKWPENDEASKLAFPEKHGIQ